MKRLFEGWQETLIYSCLDGTMGHVYGNEQSALCYLGDFFFYAGKPSLDIVSYIPEGYKNKTVMMATQNEQWHSLIEEVYQNKYIKRERYAMKKEKDVFDRDYLQRIVSQLHPSYQITAIDELLYHECLKHEQFCDFVSNYPTYEDYRNKGLGFVILKDQQIVAGASSYSSYQGGIEIEIDTHPDYRRQGLALMSGARLILECLDRHLYPSWDAHHLKSVALAQKLGYHYSHPYPIYEVCLK